MNAARLEGMLDKAAREARHDSAFGILAVYNVAEAAIAQVRAHERALEGEPRRQSQRTTEMPDPSSDHSLPVAAVVSADSRDERKAQSDLYPKSGKVIPLGTKGAPATFGRPGA